MIRFLTCALCGVSTLAMASVADAQIVRWGLGGVRVRAPFVAVDVAPYGGARIRAPFTAVDSRIYGGYPYPPGVVVGPVPPIPPIPFPGIAFGAPVYPAPVYPAPVYPGVVYPQPAPNQYQAARPSIGESLPTQLRLAAEALARSLAVRQDGDVWLDYLGPQQIIETIDLGRSPESLRTLVINYDGVMSNGSLAAIRSARGFAETRDLLKLFVSEAVVPASAGAPGAGAARPDAGAARPDAAVRVQPVPTPSAPNREESLPLPAPAPEDATEPAPENTPEPAPRDAGAAPVPPPPAPRPPSAPTPTPL
ncbi:MAG: hypothetical protein ACR2NZ_13795 [Rubripirellula sp.]